MIEKIKEKYTDMEICDLIYDSRYDYIDQAQMGSEGITDPDTYYMDYHYPVAEDYVIQDVIHSVFKVGELSQDEYCELHNEILYDWLEFKK